jgi:hypothetical protein
MPNELQPQMERTLPPAEAHQLAHWAEQLGVTTEELLSALEEVGPLVLD